MGLVNNQKTKRTKYIKAPRFFWHKDAVHACSHLPFRFQPARARQRPACLEMSCAPTKKNWRAVHGYNKIAAYSRIAAGKKKQLPGFSATDGFQAISFQAAPTNFVFLCGSGSVLPWCPVRKRSEKHAVQAPQQRAVQARTRPHGHRAVLQLLPLCPQGPAVRWQLVCFIFWIQGFYLMFHMFFPFFGSKEFDEFSWLFHSFSTQKSKNNPLICPLILALKSPEFGNMDNHLIHQHFVFFNEQMMITQVAKSCRFYFRTRPSSASRFATWLMPRPSVTCARPPCTRALATDVMPHRSW